jgi:hypothetical protein
MHAYPVEYLFLLTALIVVGLASYLLRIASDDAADLVAMKANGPRKLTADSNIQQEWCRVTEGALMLLGAGTSLFLAPPPPSNTIQPQYVVWLMMLIVMGAVKVYASWMAHVASTRLRAMTPIELQETVRELPAPAPPESLSTAVEAARAEHPPARRGEDKG